MNTQGRWFPDSDSFIMNFTTFLRRNRPFVLAGTLLLFIVVIMACFFAMRTYRNSIIADGKISLPFQKVEFERIIGNIKNRRLIANADGEVTLSWRQQRLTKTGKVYVMYETDGNSLIFFPTDPFLWSYDIFPDILPPTVLYSGYLYSEASLIPRLKSGLDVIRMRCGNTTDLFEYHEFKPAGSPHWYFAGPLS